MFMNIKTLKKQIQTTLQLFMIVFIALEVGIEPNPYKNHIIITAVIVIALKHNVVDRILKSLDRFGILIKKYL